MTARTRSLPQAIFTNQLMLVLLSMLATSLFIFFIFQHDLELRAERDSQVLAKVVRDQVQGFLNTPQLLLRGLELQIETEAAGSEKIWNHRMDRLIDFSNLFDAVYLLDDDNMVVSVGLPLQRRALRDDYLGTNRRVDFSNPNTTYFNHQNFMHGPFNNSISNML